MNFEDELEKYGFKVYWRNNEGHNSDDPDDYEPIDFSISDETDNVAWVWGSEPFSDVQVECDHPEISIEWGDDDECGECPLCGAQCNWHWAKDVVNEGHDCDGNYYAYSGDVREIDEWHKTKNKGLIGKYLKHLQEKW